MFRHVHILGAGISGLICAREFLRRGIGVTIYERLTIPGGLARSERWGQWIYDIGPHIFHTYDQTLVQEWKTLFPNIFVEGEFFCMNYRKGRFYNYPLSLESIAEYPPNERDAILEDLSNINPLSSAHAANFREYIRGLVGPTLQKLFFEDYPEKLWGLTTDRMDANWAPKRIEIREKNGPFYAGQWAAVGRRGAGCFAEAIAKDVESLGGTIRYGWQVEEVSLGPGNTVNSIRFSDGTIVSLSFSEIVVSTLSITALARFLGWVTTLAFRQLTLVNLVYAQPRIFAKDIHFLYFGDSDIPFHRVSEQKAFSSEKLPEDETLLTLELASSGTSALDHYSDQELISKAHNAMQRLPLPSLGEPKKALVARIGDFLPLQTTGYRHELASIQAKLEMIGNLFCCGGPAEFLYADIQILYHKAKDFVDRLLDPTTRFQKNIKALSAPGFNPTVYLSGRKVGQGQPVFVIAEIGLNHNGDMEIAKQLIEAAAECGCDAAKLQLFSAESRASPFYKEARYAEKTLGMEENLYELFRRLELSHDDYRTLLAFAEGKGICLFATPFDESSLSFLIETNAPFYKVASMDLVNLPLLAKIARTGRPILLSSGMATLGEVEEALDAISAAGGHDVVLLHCTSSYPCPPEAANLRAMDVLAKAFDIPIGFSDHTQGTAVTLAAVARGATVIERHFTLDRRMEGPDHTLSLEPPEMKALVQDIRKVEASLAGSGRKQPATCEYAARNQFRKSLFAAVDLAPGDTLTMDRICIQGPGYGILPKYLPIVLGRLAKNAIPAGHPILWENI